MDSKWLRFGHLRGTGSADYWPRRSSSVIRRVLHQGPRRAEFPRSLIEGGKGFGGAAFDEEDALFPTHHGTAKAAVEIRSVLQGYMASGAALEFDRQVAFETGDIALVQNAWTLTTAGGDKVRGVTVEVARRQFDVVWKYVIDSPDGAVLLGDRAGP
jgi:hypothetical protein